MSEYIWTDNPTESGVANCDTDVLNNCLMHLKYTKSTRNIASTESSVVRLTDADLHLYDGSLLTGSGSYADFVNFMANKYNNDTRNRLYASTPVQRLTGDNWQSIAYGNNKYVALSRSGISTSSDGITWSTPTDAGVFNTGTWYSITYGNSKFVAVGGSDDKAYITTSSDGTTWGAIKQFTAKNNASTFGSITYGNSKFVAISRLGETLTSSDGTTWALSQSGGPTMALNLGHAYGNNKFVSFGMGVGDGTYQIATSTNGTIWGLGKTIDILNSKNWASIVFDGSIFYLLGKGYVSTSSDGTTWTKPKFIMNLQDLVWQGCVYDGNKFVALCSNGKISFLTWERENFCTEEEWQYSVDNYGQCGKYVYDSVNNTLRLPKIAPVTDDVFSSEEFKYAVVGTSVKQDIEVDLDNIANDLANKLDYDLRNISNKAGFRKLIKANKNDEAWFKIYREYDTVTGEYIGLWAECGDLYYKGSTMAATDSTVAFPFVASDYQFSDTKYTFIPNAIHSDANVSAYGVYEKYVSRTASSTVIRTIGALFGYSWYACGYVEKK